MKSEAVLEKLRKICLALPETEEVVRWGHPNFRVRGKTFAVFEEYKSRPLSIALNVGTLNQGIFLDDPRFYKTPYVGKHGWVSLIAEGRLNWTEIKELVKGSYQLIKK